MSEVTAHQALAQFLRTASARVPSLAFVWHTANESAGGAKSRHGVPIDVLKEASMGAVAGVWDWLFIGESPKAPGYHGVAIELKSDAAYRKKHQGLSNEQLAWRDHYDRCNWLCAVYPESKWQDAAMFLIEYCGGNPNDFQFT